MHKGKKAILTLAAVVLVTSQVQAIPAAATANKAPAISTAEYAISPMWVDADQVFPGIFSSGKKITATLNIRAKKNTTALSGTLYLEESNGGRWRTVASWTFDGTGKFRENYMYSGKSGATYRTKVVATVGTDSISKYSTEITI